MKEFVPVLKRTKLFSGVGEDDMENFTFREMIIGATAVFLGILKSEKYSARHMWHRKAEHS